MRRLCFLVCAFALLMPAASAASRGGMNYMDDPGDGAVWGAFYACLPDGCGWWFCWPDEPCYAI